jgi:heptosyltransferase III
VVIKNILIIIQRSNGDVLLSTSLINQLNKNLQPNSIDLLVNQDTLGIAKCLRNVDKIFTFSYKEKKENRLLQEKNIIQKIFKKYDLCINLTSSDRSVIYALLAAKQTISAVEKNKFKSWWKILLLNYSYIYEDNSHILLNNLKPLNFLNIQSLRYLDAPVNNQDSLKSVKSKLTKLNIKEFIIFHPSAQYEYKVYDEKLRSELLKLIDTLNFPIVVTGGLTQIDSNIKRSLPELKNIYDLIGETSMEEFIALSSLSIGYIGMDTLNMHIAASQNKRIFAIFGPTNPKMWSPWSNELQTSLVQSKSKQTYSNITIFQADMPCVACGLKGCNNNGLVSDCLKNINPNLVFKEIKDWFYSYSL